MSTISLRLPESLHQQARQLAQQENISINQLVATALAEKMSALMTQAYLEQRAAGASREKFVAALGKVPAIAPDEQDKLE